MALIDILAVLELVSKNGSASTAHHAELPGQIRQILHGRRWCLRRCRYWPSLRHLGAAALRYLGTSASKGSTEYITQNLAENVAAGDLRSTGTGTVLSARHGDLDRSAATDNDRLDGTVLDPFQNLTQNSAEEIATGARLATCVGRNRKRRTLRGRTRGGAPRSRPTPSENLSQDIAERASASG